MFVLLLSRAAGCIRNANACSIVRVVPTFAATSVFARCPLSIQLSLEIFIIYYIYHIFLSRCNTMPVLAWIWIKFQNGPSVLTNTSMNWALILFPLFVEHQEIQAAVVWTGAWLTGAAERWLVYGSALFFSDSEVTNIYSQMAYETLGKATKNWWQGKKKQV